MKFCWNTALIFLFINWFVFSGYALSFPENKTNINYFENLDFGIGTIPLFIFDGTSIPAWFITNYSFPINDKKLYIGMGFRGGTVIGAKKNILGIVYGNTTVGSMDRNFNIGVGYVTYGYTEEELEKSPALILGGRVRTGNKSFFRSENYFMNTTDGATGVISLEGQRILNKFSFNYGLYIPIGAAIDRFVAIPWVGITFAPGRSD